MKWGITELQAVSMTLLSFPGHNLGTAPIEDAINEHPAVAERNCRFPHDIRNALYGFVILKETGEYRDREI
jgi:acetyl-CoA synthetase